MTINDKRENVDNVNVGRYVVGTINVVNDSINIANDTINVVNDYVGKMESW